MTLKDCTLKLETSQHPVAFNLVANQECKVQFLLFTTGMSLKAHKTQVDAELYIVDGTIIYKDESVEMLLTNYDKMDIKAGTIHSVECVETARCLLIQKL